ncbi:MAG: hypothetical protein MUC76_04555 [Spirochaetes bacterium]|jgi:hypothetical protein|nr:hypothetical protein [Spirochaetota bacterium]
MRRAIISIRLIAGTALLAFMAALMPVYAQEAPKKAPAEDKKESAQPVEDIGGWRVKDFKPYIQAMRDLQKLSREYAENLLKVAIDEYSTGLDILEDMENEVAKIAVANKDKKNLNERWYWQEIDRKNQEARQIAKLRYDAKLKSVTYFTRAINRLDEVQFTEVRKDPKFVTFQSRLYQVYVSCQYDVQNLKPCIPILERYIALTDANSKDVWAYRYLSSCYGFMENMVGKFRLGSEEETLKYKQLKNRNMLKATEIQYGIESPEYKHIQEIVEINEKKTERLNDFK